MLSKFKHLECFEQFMTVVAMVALVWGVVAISLYTFRPKEFRGYYLSHKNTKGYVIYINWENAPDELAFRTFDKDVLMEVYEKLKSAPREN